MKPVKKLPRCELHLLHRPRNFTIEYHHIIPQAWQRDQWPPEPRYSFERALPVDQDLGLFDARTAPLCPTGHRNVHYWIVKIMKEFKRVTDENPSLGEGRALVHAHKTVAPARRGKEFEMALEAPARFIHSNCSLKQLVAKGIYGIA